MKEGLRILLIEDNYGDATLVRLALERSGFVFNLVHKKDGPSALYHLRDRSNHPDVVLLDLNLPLLSGHEVLRRLRGFEGLKKTPVIVLSTSDYVADVRLIYKLDGTAYFLKPIDIRGYERILRQVVLFWPDYSICQRDPLYIQLNEQNESETMR